MDMNFNTNFAAQGWQCPICKRVYAPFMSMCTHCGIDEITTTTTMTIGDSIATTDTTQNFREKPKHMTKVTESIKCQ